MFEGSSHIPAITLTRKTLACEVVCLHPETLTPAFGRQQGFWLAQVRGSNPDIGYKITVFGNM